MLSAFNCCSAVHLCCWNSIAVSADIYAHQSSGLSYLHTVLNSLLSTDAYHINTSCSFISTQLEMPSSFAAENPMKESKADMALRVFCEDSTAHGLKRIVSAQTRPAQVFWALIFISAMGALVAHLYLRFVYTCIHVFSI